MTVTITKSPRDNVEVRRNYCAAPIGSGYVQGAGAWSSLGAGAMDATGAGTIVKSWTAAQSVIQGSGIRYVDTSWVPGEFRHIVFSAYINGYTARMMISCTFLNSSGGVISSVNSAEAVMFSNFTSTMEGLFQAPAGTASVRVDLVHGPSSGLPQANNGIAFSHVLIEYGTTTGLDRYFDGNTYANGNGSQSTVWAGSAGFSQSILLDWDPANVFVPALSEGWDQTNPGRTALLELLDGTVGVVLQVAGARRGTLRLYFGGVDWTAAAAKDAATNAAVQLCKAGTFGYVDSALGALASFVFAVDVAGVRLYASPSRRTWLVEVAYMQVS